MIASRLPEGWSAPSFVEDVIDVDGLELRRAGVSAVAPTGEELTGSAAGVPGTDLDRGHFELLERAATLEAIRAKTPTLHSRSEFGAPRGPVERELAFQESPDPARWRYARSNGVAIHSEWGLACERARWELVERDCVLRSWYGESRPTPVPTGSVCSALERAASYEWCAFEFSAASGARWCEGVEVAGVFGFPLGRELPVAFGYAGRPQIAHALEAAASEAAQVLAFLWGEAVPDREPTIGPTAMHHLERLLWPEHQRRLRAWLEGGHVGLGGKRGQPSTTQREVVYLDLTPKWLADDLCVVKAIHDDAEPLAFGESPFVSHLPPPLRSHPIA